MMRQYHAAKEACPDALLLFRMGDFYELFHEDARTAARILGLTLTSRDKSDDPVPMAGFPFHQLDTYVGKLIKAGIRVAVCEQVEDPRTAKGLVRREITQVISPGTVTDPALLEPGQSNYLACVCWPARNARPEPRNHRPATRGRTRGADSAADPVDAPVDAPVEGFSPAPGLPPAPVSDPADRVGLAWAELSTGAFAATVVRADQLQDLLERINPSEVLFAETHRPLAQALPGNRPLTARPAAAFAPARAKDQLCRQFSLGSLDGLGFADGEESAIAAAGAVVEYLRESQSGSLEHLVPPVAWRAGQFVEIDQATWRSLEITRTLRNGGREGSLFGVIDHSATPMGSRLLGQWLTEPLLDPVAIDSRLDAVAELVADSRCRSDLRALLKQIFDLERLIARVATLRASPRELRQIARTLAEVPRLAQRLAAVQSAELQQIVQSLDPCEELKQELELAILPDCPPTIAQGGFIQDGYSAPLDELRQLASGGKQWIASYQQQIIADTGISSLKVGYNKVFGYYIEVTNTHQEKVPAWFIRKQTLKNVERYITPELKEYEEKVLTADQSAIELEQQIFSVLRDRARAAAPRLVRLAGLLARLDVLAGLAELAARQNYCRPSLDDSCRTEIIEGRHPVLDLLQPQGAFVPNDTRLSDQDGFLHLITGPNMAGKSTYIRQVALICLMAQIGSFVPARSARIGIADRIFARVGASDELSRGQSTFMVEMTEAARILNTATPRSLVILDEIGRGTSTYDGVSLAWAIAEFLHEHAGCRTLFATHYHELTRLEQTFSGIRNYNVSVREWEERIVFLHKIVPGAADRSYGIHVARLAGVPDWVNRRAQQILDNLEQTSPASATTERTAGAARSGRDRAEVQLTLFAVGDHPLLEKIRRVDTNHLTPLSALQTISSWQQELEEEPAATRR